MNLIGKSALFSMWITEGGDLNVPSIHRGFERKRRIEGRLNENRTRKRMPYF